MKNLKIIAEIGSNWNGDEILAKKLIKEAKFSGADYVKFQLRRAEDIFKITDPIWKDVKKSELSLTQAIRLKKYADKVGINFSSSVFYPEAVECLESVNVKWYKIASWTAALKHKNSLETLEAVAQTGKPVIISMGYGGNINKIQKILHKNKKFFLYCISRYPTHLTSVNFNEMLKFDGFSDHTIGYAAPIIFALKIKGSQNLRFFEKHVSVSESKGPDSIYSMSMENFKNLNLELKKILKKSFISPFRKKVS